MTKANSAKRMLRVSSSILLFISIANSTVFAAETTAIILSLNYFRYVGPVYQNVVVYISLASVHYADLKPLVNSYIQKLVQTEWHVAVHGRDLSFETNTRATEEISALNQSWRGCNRPTSNWPY